MARKCKVAVRTHKKQIVLTNKKLDWSSAKCRTYYKSLQRILNKECEKIGLPFHVDLSAYTNTNSNIPKATARALGIGDGELHKETIVGFLKAIDQLGDGKNIGLLGLVQSAKTAVQIIAAIFSSMVDHLQNGRITFPLFVTPNGVNYVGQFEKKLKDMTRCLEDAKIVLDCNGKSISVKEYIEELTDFKSEVIRKHIVSLAPVIATHEYLKLMNAFKWHVDKPFMVLTSSKKNLELFRAIFNAVKKSKSRLIFGRDESHYAVGENSINDKVLSDQGIYEAMNSVNLSHEFQCVMTSATNWCSLHLEIVTIPVNSNYVGLDFAFKTLDKGNEKYISVAGNVKIKLPKIYNTEAFGKICGDHFLKDFIPSYYTDNFAFERACNKDEALNARYNNGDHDRYRKCMEDAFVESMDYFHKVNPHNGKGCLVRMFVNNADICDFISQVSPKLKTIKMVKGYGTSRKYDHVEELLENNQIQEDDFYIIFVTGKGRMADTYPKDCCYGFDLTRSSNFLATILQGTLGRMCGYYKNPIVVLSPDNCKKVNAFIDGGYTGENQGRLSSTTSSHSQKNICFRKENLQHIPKMDELFQRLQREAVEKSTPRLYPTKDGKKTNTISILKTKGDHRRFWDVISEYFDWMNEHLTELATGVTSEDKLIHPRRKDDSGRKYSTDKYGWPYATVRSEGKHFSKTQGGKAGDDKVVIRITTRYNKPVICGFDLLRSTKAKLAVDKGSVPGKIKRKER